MQIEKKLFNFRPLFFGFLSLLLAIAATRFLFVGNVQYIILMAVLFCLFIAYCIWKSRFLMMIIVIAVFLFGIGWYFVGVTNFEGKEYAGVVQVEGRIGDDLRLGEYGYNTVLQDVKINGERAKNINLRIKVSENEHVEIGDVISFESEVENIKLFKLGSFDSAAYRNNAPYEASVNRSGLTKIGSRITVDEQIRLSVKDALYKNMGYTYGPVGYAVLFGDKSDVDSSIKDTFKLAGVIHILTVSGLHVSFLIALIGYILKKCRIRGWLNFLICLAVLGIYSYMCGFSPSVVRAGIMGLVLLTTKISGKCYDSLNSIGLAGLIILLYSPLSALDVGFLMSFFCVLGIFIVSPWLTKIFRKFLPKGVADSFAISISASIGILPFMSSIFGSFNFLLFFINLIVVPIFSIVYPVLFLFGFATAIMPFLGFVLKVCGFGLDLIYKISDFFAATTFVESLWPMSIILTTTLFLTIFFMSKYSLFNRKFKALCCSGLLCFSLIFACVDSLKPSQSGVSYSFNYDYGMALLTNSNGNTVAVDFMANSNKVLSAVDAQNISTTFVLDYYYKDVSYMREMGVQNIIVSDKYAKPYGYDEELTSQSNVVYQVDGFEYSFISVEDDLLGLEISFDETKVFVLANKKHDAGNVISFARSNYYDFVLVGSYTGYAKYFSMSSVVLGYKNDENIDKNYLQDGNSFYKIKENGYSWRCLD